MKRILSIALAVVLACSALAVSAFAFHYYPDQNIPCYTTERITVHSKHIGAPIIGAHQLDDGTMCYITGLTMEHTVKCPTCNRIFEKYNERCTISHSACGQYYKTCLA